MQHYLLNQRKFTTKNITHFSSKATKHQHCVLWFILFKILRVKDILYGSWLCLYILYLLWNLQNWKAGNGNHLLNHLQAKLIPNQVPFLQCNVNLLYSCREKWFCNVKYNAIYALEKKSLWMFLLYFINKIILSFNWDILYISIIPNITQHSTINAVSLHNTGSSNSFQQFCCLWCELCSWIYIM